MTDPAKQNSATVDDEDDFDEFDGQVVLFPSSRLIVKADPIL